MFSSKTGIWGFIVVIVICITSITFYVMRPENKPDTGNEQAQKPVTAKEPRHLNEYQLSEAPDTVDLAALPKTFISNNKRSAYPVAAFYDGEISNSAFTVLAVDPINEKCVVTEPIDIKGIFASSEASKKYEVDYKTLVFDYNPESNDFYATAVDMKKSAILQFENLCTNPIHCAVDLSETSLNGGYFEPFGLAHAILFNDPQMGNVVASIDKWMLKGGLQGGIGNAYDDVVIFTISAKDILINIRVLESDTVVCLMYSFDDWSSVHGPHIQNAKTEFIDTMPGSPHIVFIEQEHIKFTDFAYTDPNEMGLTDLSLRNAYCSEKVTSDIKNHPVFLFQEKLYEIDLDKRVWTSYTIVSKSSHI